MIPRNSVNDIPNIIQKAIARTEDKTDIAPLIPQNQGVGEFLDKLATFMPKGNAIPIKKPIKESIITETAILIGVADALKRFQMYGLIIAYKNVTPTKDAMIMVSRLIVFELFLEICIRLVVKLPIPLEISKENRTVDNPYVGCPRKIASKFNCEISISINAKPIVAKKIIPHWMFFLSIFTALIVKRRGKIIVAKLKSVTITKQVNNTTIAIIFEFVSYFLALFADKIWLNLRI